MTLAHGLNRQAADSRAHHSSYTFPSACICTSTTTTACAPLKQAYTRPQLPGSSGSFVRSLTIPVEPSFWCVRKKTGFEGQCLKASTTGPKPRNPNCPLASRVPRSAREDCIQPSLFSMIAAQVHLRPQDQQARLPRLVSGSLILSASLVRPQPRNFDPAAPAVDLGGGFRNRQHSFHSFHCTVPISQSLAEAWTPHRNMHRSAPLPGPPPPEYSAQPEIARAPQRKAVQP